MTAFHVVSRKWAGAMRVMRSLQQLTWAGKLSPSVLGFMSILNALISSANGAPLPRSLLPTSATSAVQPIYHPHSGPESDSPAAGAGSSPAPAHSTATDMAVAAGTASPPSSPINTDDAQARRHKKPRDRGTKAGIMSPFLGHGFGPAALACAAVRWACDSGIGSGIHLFNKAMDVCSAAGVTPSYRVACV